MIRGQRFKRAPALSIGKHACYALGACAAGAAANGAVSLRTHLIWLSAILRDTAQG